MSVHTIVGIGGIIMYRIYMCILLHEWDGSTGEFGSRLAVLARPKGGPMQKPRFEYSPVLPNLTSVIIGLLYHSHWLRMTVADLNGSNAPVILQDRTSANL